MEEPDEGILAAVLGKEHHGEEQYAAEELALFAAYHKRFKLGSKPVAHLSALALVDEAALQADAPEAISRLLDMVETRLEALDE